MTRYRTTVSVSSIMFSHAVVTPARRDAHHYSRFVPAGIIGASKGDEHEARACADLICSAARENAEHGNGARAGGNA